MLVVLPQEPAHTRFILKDPNLKYIGPLREVLDGNGRPAFPILGDPACTVSATYGVAFQGFGGTHNRPATFVIDREGIIRFEARKGGVEDQPSMEKLMEIVDSLGSGKGAHKNP